MRIILIGGWGMPAGVLAPLRMALGIGAEACYSLDRPWAALRSQLLSDIQPGTVVVGWSLGGNLALQLAAEVQDRMTAVVTLANNPRFLASGKWPHAYDPGLFHQFQQGLIADPTATLARFSALATLGSAYQRDELRWLRDQLDASGRFRQPVLEESLARLAEADQRQVWQQLEIPVIGILGQNDALVPEAVASDLMALNERAQVQVIEGMAHLPSYRFASRVAEVIRERLLPVIRSWC